jgi:hypothetical protein
LGREEKGLAWREGFGAKGCGVGITIDHCKPAFLGGFRFGDWVDLLTSPGRGVDGEYVPRAVVATMLTMVTTVLAGFEPEVKLTAEQEAAWERPVFVLGLPRSGTSLLHQMMSRNPGLCFASKADCYNPHVLLLIRQFGLDRVMTGLNPERRRFMDGVQTGWLLPEEESLAMGILTGVGVRVDSIFGNPLRDTEWWPEPPEHHWGRWAEAMRVFSRKLAMVHGVPAVFKSPGNTSLIPWILDVFPRARFVMIFRHPFGQFRSLATVDRKRDDGGGWNALRRRGTISGEEVAAFGGAMAERYLATRGLVPEGNLCEVRYEDLVADPGGVLGKIHGKLGISGGDAVVAEVAGDGRIREYRRNRHPELSTVEKEMVRRHFASVFAHCEYDAGAADCG